MNRYVALRMVALVVIALRATDARAGLIVYDRIGASPSSTNELGGLDVTNSFFGNGLVGQTAAIDFVPTVTGVGTKADFVVTVRGPGGSVVNNLASFYPQINVWEGDFTRWSGLRPDGSPVASQGDQVLVPFSDFGSGDLYSSPFGQTHGFTTFLISLPIGDLFTKYGLTFQAGHEYQLGLQLFTGGDTGNVYLLDMPTTGAGDFYASDFLSAEHTGTLFAGRLTVDPQVMNTPEPSSVSLMLIAVLIAIACHTRQRLWASA